jgi:glycosyltransferase involved in cell wall biosynthesis
MNFDSTITIVLPLYKPSGNWQYALLKNVSEVEKLFERPPVFIIVNDGSGDDSVDDFFDSVKIAHPNILYHSYPKNQGKGFALRKGVELSAGSYTIVTDFDFPYDNADIKEIIRQLKNGYDVVTGKRGKSYYKSLPVKRKIASGAYRLCNSIFLRLPVNDTQSGIKGFNRKGRQVFLETTTNRFLIDTEFILRATNYRIRHKVITVTLKPHIHFTNFKMGLYKKEFFEFVKIVKLKKKLNRRQAFETIFTPVKFIGQADHKANTM